MKISKKRKRTLIILAVSVLILALACIFAVLSIRGDWRFIIGEAIGIGRESIDFHKTELSSDVIMENFTLGQLLSKENVQFDQSLMLINKDYRLDGGFSPDLVDYKDSGLKVNKCIISSFSELSDHIYENFGQKLYIMSSYRTPEEQQETYDELGGDIASEKDASEHLTGLSLDVYISGYAGKAILKTEAGRYINSQCHKYGFIIRYPLFKKSITGISYEPWHIRYVGLPHSSIIYNKNITLEEYIESMEEGSFYVSGEYMITKQKGENFYLPSQAISYVISPDNTGSYIITMVL